jgi:predicted metal-dependent phosphoesterase TrpH
MECIDSSMRCALWNRTEERVLPADLHIHSTASDGTLSPAQVVEEGARLGLSAIALCDHDTVESVGEALAAGTRLGIPVLTGVEVNTDVGDKDVHILGYRFDPSGGAVAAKLQLLRDGRYRRGEQMVRQLNDAGVELVLEDVLVHAGDGPVGRPHVAAALVDRGYVPSIDSAFGKYLKRGRPGFVERMKFTPAEAMAFIKEAGGIPAIAHPEKVKDDGLVESLVEQGLEGVEVYHTHQDDIARRKWRRFAERHGLLVTGGTDSHGPGGTTDVAIGSVCLPDEDLDRLLAAAAFQAIARS